MRPWSSNTSGDRCFYVKQMRRVKLSRFHKMQWWGIPSSSKYQWLPIQHQPLFYLLCQTWLKNANPSILPNVTYLILFLKIFDRVIKLSFQSTILQQYCPENNLNSPIKVKYTNFCNFKILNFTILFNTCKHWLYVTFKINF